MRQTRVCATILLVLMASLSLMAGWIAPAGYAAQNRDAISQSASRQFLLGTDELGRDNLARLLVGLRLSILLACSGAAVSCSLASLLGAVSGLTGGWLESAVLSCAGLMESVPWIFLFLTVRALLPLNVGPATSLWITFALLSLLGWTHAARVIQAAAAELRKSNAILYARACGIHGWRLWMIQTAPSLRVVCFTQFMLMVPSFILAESGLGLLGLGVSEPLPSLGNLLRPLENQELVRSHPEVLAPLAVLVIVMLCFRAACDDPELTA